MAQTSLSKMAVRILAFGDLSDKDKRKYWDDQLHFSPAGYDRMAEIIFEDVKHLFAEGEETWTETFYEPFFNTTG